MNPLYLSVVKYCLTHLLGTVKGQHVYDTLVNVVIPAIDTLDPAALAELEKLGGVAPK